MRRLFMLVAALAGGSLLTCGSIDAPYEEVSIGDIHSLSIELLNEPPRDSLSYVLRWGKATNATSYHVTVTATGSPPTSTTTGLPTNAVVTDTTIAFVAINTTYDSLTFNVSVTAYRGTFSNPTAATATWNVVRRPGVPGKIIVDSSAIPPIVFNGLDLNLGTYADGRRITGPAVFPWAPFPVQTIGNRSYAWACAYLRFSNGMVAMRAQDAPNCMYNYRVAYNEPARATCTPQSPAWNADGSLLRADHQCTPLANQKLQTWADRQCVTYSSSNPSQIQVTPAMCSSAGAEVVAVYQGSATILASAQGIGYGQSGVTVGW